MKDYASEKEKEKFITNVVLEEDGTLTLVFADGKKYRGFPHNKEMLDSVEKKLEKQGKSVVKKKGKFVLAQTFCGTVSGLITSAGALSILAGVQQNLQSPNPGKVLGFCIFGAAAILGGAVSLGFSLENRSKVGQIKVMEHLTGEGKNHIREIMGTPNGMAGLSTEDREVLEAAMEYPFISIDSIKPEVLERVVINGEIDQRLGVTYTDAAMNLAPKVFVKTKEEL